MGNRSESWMMKAKDDDEKDNDDNNNKKASTRLRQGFMASKILVKKNRNGLLFQQPQHLLAMICKPQNEIRVSSK